PFSDPRRIPFRIADPAAQAESPIIDNFFALLDLSGGRFEVSGVLSLLESQHIRQKFGLSEKDFELAEKWVGETRIRWGIDGQNRRNLGLPGIEENSWKAGLSRLLMGYAMPGRQKHMFSGILPYDDMEGEEAEVLGKFVEFVNRIFSSAKSLEQKQRPGQWSDILTGLLEEFFESDENRTNENTSREIGLIRRTLSSLRNISDLSGFDKKIDLNLIKNYLRQKFKKQGLAFSYIPGSVTFCAMSSMGSIPFKIICLVGMDSGAYPGESKPYGFDLMATNPEPGDPSRRNDDRYFFLETLLSAGRKFYISYMGQSIRDNSVIPPSVLVGEIMDYIEENFEIPGINIRRQMVTQHRLQAFSPAYFKGSAGPGNSGNGPDRDEKLFSYCLENFQAARSMGHDRNHPVPFVAGGLKEPEEEFKRVDLAELCRFFSNPPKFLINKRLGFSLEQGTYIPEEREPFEIKGLEKYLLEQMLMEKRLEGESLKEFQPSVIAAGRLPHGTMGKCVFDCLSRGVDGFVHWLKGYRHGNSLEPVEVELDLSGFRLTGRINSVYSERLIHYRYAKVKAKDILRIWIHHLVLNCMNTKNLKTGGYPETSVLAGLNPDGRGESVFAAWEYPPVKEAGRILENLLEKYRLGLLKPLSFFPESSMEYARLVIEKNKPAQEALRSVEKIWKGNDHRQGECSDLYHHRCFGNGEPLDSNFEKIAIEIFSPILRNQKELDKPGK
ncbi:MAG: exodeoxyribonuclease V subunit gamma, partial [Deltaproteobacteria bacterium]|nr:exodeoxyribonuclease V subunit gamma [Deltaproteobacteria bacterium]